MISRIVCPKAYPFISSLPERLLSISNRMTIESSQKQCEEYFDKTGCHNVIQRPLLMNIFRNNILQENVKSSLHVLVKYIT